MESLAKFKRRSVDLFHSLPQNLPSMPRLPHLPNLQRSGGDPTMKGTWQRISVPPLPRSSHSLDIVAGNAYIFGGEIDPRKPVDNDMHIIALPSSGAPADYYAVKARVSPKRQFAENPPPPITEEDEAAAELKDTLADVPLSSPTPPTAEDTSATTAEKGKNKRPDSEVPCARVGHATAVIGSRIFLFGGRNVESSSEPLDEGGRVWIFETKTHTWSYLDPYRNSPVPPARSYFAATATDKPRDFAIKPLHRASSWKEWAEGDSADVGIPQRPIAGSVAATATDEEEAGFGTFIIHGGCTASGGRTGDVWAFDVRSCTWKELPAAPGPARGGAALALAKSRLYRFGGYSGQEELGGQLDVLELGLDEFDDRVSRGEVGVFARGGWQTIEPAAAPVPPQGGDEAAKLVPAEEWPGNRSVSSMELVLGGGGREYLVLMLGEQSPSSEGHAGAGQFWGDVWAFQVPPLGMTAASVTDAILQSMGRKTGEGRWTRVTTTPYDDEDNAAAEGPGPRGWIASAPLGDLEENAVFVFGGLDGSNRRLGDGWIFRLQ
ncbi:hypothetical protein GGS23DRAFT_586895 [Durotheca rogersii]|uniref:uncharacterized protein n=1 Tax=Durotheca rogersii TaxID=419775 RepID=UPI00221FAFC8|nr:uncharacterized protein GGS23DRAFT_586895 [Durotheca rogersii]KAI5858171.1 hypothetical protein GGS23DRAFT_586895 [Durotheca rogersii]